MKSSAALWFCGWLALGCLVTPVEAMSADSALSARPSLHQRREAAQKRLEQEERECAQRVLVNDCLRSVRERSRPELETLRREEFERSAQQRQAQADARRLSLASRSAPTPNRSAASQTFLQGPVPARQPPQPRATTRMVKSAEQLQSEQDRKLQAARERARAQQVRQKQAAQHRQDVLARHERMAPQAPALPPAP